MRLTGKQFRQLIREANVDWIRANRKKGDPFLCPDCGASYQYGVNTWCEDCGRTLDDAASEMSAGTRKDYNERNPNSKIPG